MGLPRLLSRWYWRVDSYLGGDAPPGAGQRFSAAHPVRLGLIVSAASAGLFGVVSLVRIAATGSPAPSPSLVIVWLGGGAAVGLLFTAVGHLERRRQQHYGHYPPGDGGAP